MCTNSSKEIFQYLVKLIRDKKFRHETSSSNSIMLYFAEVTMDIISIADSTSKSRLLI